MRIRIAALCLFVLACGKGDQQATAPTGGTASATGVAPSASASAVAATPSSSAAPSASVATPEAPLGRPLKDTLANAKTIQLVWRQNLDSKEGVIVDIKTDATVKAIIKAIGPDQIPQGGVPGTMITFNFAFMDQAGNKVATIGLASSTSMRDSHKKYGRIDLPDGSHAGIIVSDYDDLQKRLKAINVSLP